MSHLDEAAYVVCNEKRVGSNTPPAVLFEFVNLCSPPQDGNSSHRWMAAQIVRQPHLSIFYLAWAGLALELLIEFIHHSKAGSAHRMAEGLESSIGVDRKLPFQLESPAVNLVLALTRFTESQVFVG